MLTKDFEPVIFPDILIQRGNDCEQYRICCGFQPSYRKLQKQLFISVMNAIIQEKTASFAAFIAANNYLSE